MVAPAEDLLRRLTAGDESCLQTVLTLTPNVSGTAVGTWSALTPRITSLVRLAALVAVDASTASLHWAAELASIAGASDDEIVGVLVAVAPDVGSARVVSCAPRLAVAIGYDIAVEGWDSLLTAQGE